MNECLRVDGVTKHFGNRSALKNVSFSVRRGEVLGLIGPNGAGKTTLFECLAGLMHADAGTMKSGDNLVAVSRRKEALFYLPDAIVPWAEQTVAWALEFFERVYGGSKTIVSELMWALGRWNTSPHTAVAFFNSWQTTRRPRRCDLLSTDCYN